MNVRTALSSVTAWLVSAWRDSTIEPAIAVYMLSGGILHGSGVTTEIKIWKVIFMGKMNICIIL